MLGVCGIDELIHRSLEWEEYLKYNIKYGTQPDAMIRWDFVGPLKDMNVFCIWEAHK